jgi:glycosyltransferase involved in cell wall biosynthesis
VKIAQVSLLYDPLAPCPSSNAARALLYLVEELVSEGHELTLFAVEPCETSAPCVHLRHVERHEGPARLRVRVAATVAREADRFDVVHFHCDQLNFRLPGPVRVPSVATLHAPCTPTSRYPVSDVLLVPTSRRQQQFSTAANWGVPPIPPGLPYERYRLHAAAGAYAVFTGSLQPESGLESAVAVAARCGLPLKVIGAVNPQHRNYFLETFRPLLRSSPNVQWVSELDDYARSDVLGGAAALLASYDRSGASTLNIAEALACGTPVIAWSDTTASDIVQDGVTGFVVKDVEQAANALQRAATLDRRACRRAFEEQFDVRVIAARYLELYHSINHAYDAAAVTVGSCVQTQRRWSGPAQADGSKSQASG